MSLPDDLRLIEDYLPIEAISAEASREKSVRKGHISTLHLWWARRPLVACRAAVYGALVPADRWVKDVNLKNPPDDAEKVTKTKNGKKKGLNRKAAKEFVTKLCRYPKSNPTKEEDVRVKLETEAAIVEAQRHILEAHADRLTAELDEARKTGKSPVWIEEFNFEGDQVTYEDIVAGRAPRPRVLDMFAGGGAIPLEALRLGCEAYALDLNPVAHIIQLCTLVYPQKYGKPDPNARGMTGPKNTQGETTWGGLAAEVLFWGDWVLDRVRKEIGDLYPPIPDPEVWSTLPDIAFDQETGQWNVIKEGKLKRGLRLDQPQVARSLLPADDDDDTDNEPNTSPPIPLLPGFLQPVAYLWTRTVRCKNPSCGSTVPLVRQTWLCKKKGRHVALRLTAAKANKKVRFDVVEVATERELGFSPSKLSQAGNATCPFCGTVADSDYVKTQGCEGRLGLQLMSFVCSRHGASSKAYVSADEQPDLIPSDVAILERIDELCSRTGLTPPTEPIVTDAKNSCWTHLYGLTTFRDLFTPRQLYCLLAFAAAVHEATHQLNKVSIPTDHATAVVTCIGMLVDRVAVYSSSQCVWHYLKGERTAKTFGRQALPMTWDFSESAPFNEENASYPVALKWLVPGLEGVRVDRAATVQRGSAFSLPWHEGVVDAIITDPPYYDNVPYANLADYFYVWLKRTVGQLYPDHFTTDGTPKKREAVADATRHGGSKKEATSAYERMMADSFSEAHRVLKTDGHMAVVYAHKTTLGWSTLVDALRLAGFTVTEAWPIDTEMQSRLRGRESAALSSSIFLVARKRARNAGIGNYEDDVRPDLQQIVRERVDTLWEMGIAGADLVIACVGAGLRAFTKYERVEYANGEEVPAEKFLAEVEGVVLDTMMGKLFGQSGASVSAIDPASRFYILWRFVYKAAEIDAGEAIVFTYAQHVELDGPDGLSTGKGALVEKKKAKYRTRDFSERGDNEKLGLPEGDGQTVPLIDVLHRILWLVEHGPRKLTDFLIEASPDRERLRVLAQALAGAALSGKSGEDAKNLVTTTVAEQAALGETAGQLEVTDRIRHRLTRPTGRQEAWSITPVRVARSGDRWPNQSRFRSILQKSLNILTRLRWLKL